MPSKLHLTVDTLALKLLLESTESLVDVVVTHDDLHWWIGLQGGSELGDCFYRPIVVHGNKAVGRKPAMNCCCSRSDRLAERPVEERPHLAPAMFGGGLIKSGFIQPCAAG
jgi:hypothetical protein